MGIIAWLFLVGLGRVLARHYRDAFDEKEVLGARIWFQVHRVVMILVALVTVAIIFLIFGTLKWRWTLVCR